jgi:integrase
VVRLLLHNALRVDEVHAADGADLDEYSSHRVLRVVRKRARKARIPLTQASVAALDAYLATGQHGPGWGSGDSWAGRCWPPRLAGGCAKVTRGSWCAALPVPPGSGRFAVREEVRAQRPSG